MPRVVFRPLKALEEFRACERIQQRVWGNVGVASEVLIVTAKYGGVVLGAFLKGRVAGFIYAFLAERQGERIHWSHQMAVEPEVRDQGLGFRMKLAHRKLALARGIRSICWTFDPLQSRNAALNIGRLGGRADEYIIDCYGRFPSRIERGLPSDRLVVDWRIDSTRVAKRLKSGAAGKFLLGLPRVNETAPDRRGFLVNQRIELSRKEPRLLLEIPSNTDAMRARALGLASRWRLETRKIFQRYIAAGYAVADFIPPSAAEGRCFYVLERKSRP